ncbi:hypothetical protein [Mycobacterium sp. AZCC_0083]|uniref:hypothetical protein n=1 Tax=Mycobacterium sp. AZCC_0083 TaxID=2735882 RepID=UPI00160BE195|nr:hypothetical protein [Mycobacterium sp. AZCC_0083]MBB5166480.1 hypothetical protein [Mycobacterium sp. AZCC_0083]
MGRIVLMVLAILVVSFLSLRALSPKFAADYWFGRPDSWLSVVIVIVVMTVLAVWTYRSRNPGGAAGIPVAIITGLGATSLVLGFSSYWQCHDGQHPSFFTALTFTGALVKGTIGDQSIGEPNQPQHLCPIPTPVALDVARLSAQAAIFVGLASVAVALFRSQTDRFHIRRAGSVTAVVGIDDDTPSMISAIAKTVGPRVMLVVITDIPEQACVYEARNHGARIVTVDFSRPETLAALSLWRKLDRLYLLSADPSANLQRLAVITKQLPEDGRLPLIVRIDDPWQAEVWRAQQFGGSDRHWAADAVGKYEVTARRLLDAIINVTTVDRILVCGASPLTLALCADMAQRWRERDFYTAPDEVPLPSVTLVAQRAKEYVDDHDFHQQQLGLTSAANIDAVDEAPAMSTLLRLIGEHDHGVAVILVDADSTIDTTIGTRLAARFRDMPVYGCDQAARVAENRVPIIGQLRTYNVAMDVAEGQAHDAWERAAMLIHSNWATSKWATGSAARPWAQLDEFYRESNRRQVRNILRVVEEKGEHTWSSGSAPAAQVSAAELQKLPPLEQLRRLGFENDAALAIVRAEHEDWYSCYRNAGWQLGKSRDDTNKIHNRLKDWKTTAADPELLDRAADSVAGTLLQLLELGYRSRPVWEAFRRTGTVTAEQRGAAWTWTAHSGETMQAKASDWAVQDAGGDSWSVGDGIFQDSYEEVDPTEKRWRRIGVVSARPARVGETLQTREGPTQAAPGDWVVKGTRDELWAVSASRFAQRYERVEASTSGSQQPR